jgi:hypothetical protein
LRLKLARALITGHSAGQLFMRVEDHPETPHHGGVVGFGLGIGLSHLNGAADRREEGLGIDRR